MFMLLCSFIRKKLVFILIHGLWLKENIAGIEYNYSNLRNFDVLNVDPCNLDCVLIVPFLGCWLQIFLSCKFLIFRSICVKADNSSCSVYTFDYSLLKMKCNMPLSLLFSIFFLISITLHALFIHCVQVHMCLYRRWCYPLYHLMFWMYRSGDKELVLLKLCILMSNDWHLLCLFDICITISDSLILCVFMACFWL